MELSSNFGKSLNNTEKPLKGQIALITGASRGIGAAVAEAYAAAGAELILVGRSIEHLERVDDAVRQWGTKALLVPFDLRQPLLIEQLAKTIAQQYGYLDILVGNAGYLHSLSPLTHLSPLEWEQTLQTNLTANWHLLRWFDPLLQRSPQKGRAIFVTADVAKTPQAYWGAYAVSKAGLEALVLLYAKENVGITVNLIEPGRVQTALRLKAMPGEKKEKIPLPSALTNLFVAAAHPACPWKGQILTVEQIG